MGNSTCWTVIHGAAAGDPRERETFARLYAPVVRAYLAARWRNSRRRDDVEDAFQDVFLECFRQGGVLERVDSAQQGGFRAFLYGVVRNVALRRETDARRNREVPPPSGVDLGELIEPEEDLSRTFDRAWATTLVEEALSRQWDRARDAGDAALKRLELLRLRFQDGLPIRDIARRWEVDADRLHEEYGRARAEFKEALIDVVTFHHPSATAGEAERESLELLSLLK
jgi:RNA polymerase sigma factor (sigma-70 family)